VGDAAHIVTQAKAGFHDTRLGQQRGGHGPAFGIVQLEHIAMPRRGELDRVGTVGGLVFRNVGFDSVSKPHTGSLASAVWAWRACAAVRTSTMRSSPRRSKGSSSAIASLEGGKWRVDMPHCSARYHPP